MLNVSFVYTYTNALQAVAVKPDHVSVVAGLVPPPVVVMTMGMRTTVNPKTHQNEIAMVSCLVHQDFPLDKAAPQPPFQLHFCGELMKFLSFFFPVIRYKKMKN